MVNPDPTMEADLREIEARAAPDLAYFDGKRVLVTGGAGFLLSHLVELLVRRIASRPAGPRSEVVVADTFTTGTASRLAHLAGMPGLRVASVDVSKPEATDALGGSFDVVVHGASIASPSFYRAKPLATLEVNAMGTYHLLRSTAGSALERFVLLSTSEVYGDPDPRCVPTPETYEGRVSFTGPRACYDESKRFAETVAVTYQRTYGVPVRIVRPFNVYGPGLRLDDGRVVPSLARDALAGRDLVLHSDGTPRRSFCYATDFLVGFLRATVGGEDGEAYNVGDDRAEVSMRELAERVRAVSGSRGEVRVVTSPDPDFLTDNPQRRSPDLRKLRALGGGEPCVSLDEGLRRYLAWARTSTLASTSPRVGA